ncbi:MAG: hypothetical protein ACYSU1_05475 [Planctomycetota bacterium]
MYSRPLETPISIDPSTPIPAIAHDTTWIFTRSFSARSIGPATSAR